MQIERPISNNPIPEHAKRVFKGKIFDVYQWEQKGYDGKIHIYEKVKRSDTALVISVAQDGKIIIGKQEQPGVRPFTGLIGGRIDEGEEPLEAAKRELLEETGYQAKEWLLFYAIQPVSKIDWAIYIFIAKGCHKVSEPHLDGAEKIELLFLDFDAFVDAMIQDECRDEWLKTKIFQIKLDSLKREEMKKMLGL